MSLAPASPRTAEVEIVVPFHDVDSAEVAWHGHYVKYLEIARCALLQTFNYDYPQMRESGYFWPIIDLQLRYVRPAVFGQRIIVRATLVEWEHRLKIDYLIRDSASGQRLTRGSSAQVAVDMRNREMCLASPDILFERLGLSRS